MSAPIPTGNYSQDKEIVRDYFNSNGFDRWRRIYGEGEVSKVQRDIRVGHQQTVDHVLRWLRADGALVGMSICDAGCGVGSLSFPLAAAGAQVYASDISAKMIAEAQSLSPDPENPKFEVNDLEGISGEYDTVICLDVIIHYPFNEAEEMIRHLASLSRSRLIISFAPKNPFYTMLKRIGEFFPGSSKATRAYLHPEKAIKKILADLGFKVKRSEFTATQFYFSRVYEAVK
ncbi:Mg-protoporphyrin IX methyltransferase [Thalassoporum mexicanum PCC 7367]|uniref:magnesium protoporphyrin IX methyltransferase n=1 Tax=Thalassoporum mexicanum TaxID=3457544 RepID=UPI00029FAF7C|nr:magnesium protoporphyrin IX methyltransferase [Pseudanabaena sp. PCC 7367]AFY69555.1 Mg-protoporphyrin IX methyltransferase [Pseudanabaena sp. PCC 7367]